MLSDSHGASTRLRAPAGFPPPVPPIPATCIERNARRDPATMQAIGEEWPRLVSIADALAELYDPDEIPIEDFVSLWQSVMRLSAFGVRFSDAFLDRLDELQASIEASDEDSDSDATDEHIDLEDADEDYSVDDFPCDIIECSECESGDGGEPSFGGAPWEYLGDYLRRVNTAHFGPLPPRGEWSWSEGEPLAVASDAILMQKLAAQSKAERGMQ